MKRTLALLIFAAALFGENAPTPLTQDESDRLVVFLIGYYEAQIGLLDALSASKAGNVDMQRASQARQQVQGLLAELQKAHGASASCTWDFSAKQWACGPVK